MRILIVSTAALFDDDPQTSNLPKLIRASLAPDAAEFFRGFHAHYVSVAAPAHCSGCAGYDRLAS
jgi:hypothetical protein